MVFSSIGIHLCGFLALFQLKLVKESEHFLESEGKKMFSLLTYVQSKTVSQFHLSLKNSVSLLEFLEFAVFRSENAADNYDRAAGQREDESGRSLATVLFR
jgi:hypothetical protein